MQKVEKLIQSGDIGPPADILSQNCQKRAIRPRNVHAPKSRSDSSLQEHNSQLGFLFRFQVIHLKEVWGKEKPWFLSKYIKTEFI